MWYGRRRSWKRALSVCGGWQADETRLHTGVDFAEGSRGHGRVALSAIRKKCVRHNARLQASQLHTLPMASVTGGVGRILDWVRNDWRSTIKCTPLGAHLTRCLLVSLVGFHFGEQIVLRRWQGLSLSLP